MDDKKPENSYALAVERTVMAADRSLMAWTRTGVALIAFGFTIYKFLQNAPNGGNLSFPLQNATPRTIGLYLVGIGTLAIILGCAEFVAVLKDLRTGSTVRAWRASLLIAVAIGLFGLALFVSVIIGPANR